MAKAFSVDWGDLERLFVVMEQYQGDTENAINDVLHNQANEMLKDSIRLLMPVSGKTWKGKKPAAKTGRSLVDKKENLAITVRTPNAYGYLYFPNDGSNTYRHAGNQQFFERGGEARKNEIIDLLVNRLVSDFDN